MYRRFYSIDMGGYQAAVDLASDPTIGLYAGILISATTGCTLAFTIPMGMGLSLRRTRTLFPEDDDRSHSHVRGADTWRPCRRMRFFPLLKERAFRSCFSPRR